MRYRYSTTGNGKLVKKAVVYTQDEHEINFSDVDSHAVYVTERLQSNGFETYIVGGAVRDLILKKKPKDFDIVTAASPTKIKRIFRNARIIGRRFRLVHVYFGPKIFEISTFRSMKDGFTSNTFGTIEEDVRRRDFTLNALFYDPLTQVVVDYVGGLQDIRKRKIRAIISPEQIFADDPVRIIRAIKYAALTGFILPLSLKWRIKAHSRLLADVSPSRLTEEIFKIIHSPYTLEIVKSLDSMDIYRFLQPKPVDLFKTVPGFKERYFKTMEALGSGNFKNQQEGRSGQRNDDSKPRREVPGQAVLALIRDYLEEAVDWDGGLEGALPSAELYKSAFAMARKFLLPMNPPRAELELALRLLFSEHGLQAKKPRHHIEKPRRHSRRPAPAD